VRKARPQAAREKHAAGGSGKVGAIGDIAQRFIITMPRTAHVRCKADVHIASAIVDPIAVVRLARPWPSAYARRTGIKQAFVLVAIPKAFLELYPGPSKQS
jgi:hypothetical protein